MNAEQLKMLPKGEVIKIRGANEHNLKNLSIDIPRNKFVVLTGLSGSGKSSLAFDTIYAEGQRRYMESLSSYARMFLGQMEKPNVERIEGLSPAISIDQKSTNRNPRSTVGTVTEIYDYFRLLDEPFAFVDEYGKNLLWKLIQRKAQEGKGIIITSHEEQNENFKEIHSICLDDL